MQHFTQERDETTPDEIWLLQHPPTFTQGQSGKEEYLLNPDDIPVINIDRGGQVTYHGPGQWVVYLLIDLRRRGLGVKQLVNRMEQSIITLLQGYGLEAQLRSGAPGVYIGNAKIASLGLRIKQGRSYHGLALNVDMDLEPFSRIVPCGLSGVSVTDMRQQDIDASLAEVGERLIMGLTIGKRRVRSITPISTHL